MADVGDDSLAKRTCWTCALGKRGCDGEWPCGRCAKLGKSSTCKQAPAGYKRVLRIIKEDSLAPAEGEDMIDFCERMSLSSAMQGGRKRRVAEVSADGSDEPKQPSHRSAPQAQQPPLNTLSLPVFVRVWQAAGGAAGAVQGADDLLKDISAHACGEQQLTTTPTAFLGPGCAYANGASPVVRIPEDYLRMYAALGVFAAGTGLGLGGEQHGGGAAATRIRLDAKQPGCLPLVTADLPYTVLDTFAEAALMCDATPAIRLVYPQGGLFMPSSALFNQAVLDLLGTCAGEAAAWVSMAKEPPFLHHAYALPRMLLALHAASTGMIQTAFRGVYVQRLGEGRHCTPPACAVDPLDPKVAYRPFAATELVRYEHYPDGSVRTQTVYFLDIRWPGEGVKAVMVAGEPYPAPSTGGTGIEAQAGVSTCPDDFIIDLSLLQGSTKLLISCPGEFSEVRTITAAVQAKRGGGGGKGGEQTGDSRSDDMPAATALATSLTPAIMSAIAPGGKLHTPWPHGPCWILPPITPVTLEQARGLLAQSEAMLMMEGRGLPDMESELQQSLIKARVVNDNAAILANATSDLLAPSGGSSSALANLAATAWSSSSAPAPAPGTPQMKSCCCSSRLLFSAHGVELHCVTGLKLRLSGCTAPVFSWLAMDRYEAAIALDVLAHAALQAATGHAAQSEGKAPWPPQATVRLTTDAGTGAVLVLLDVPAGPLLRPPCKPAPVTHLTWLVLSGSKASEGEGGPFAAQQGYGLEQATVPARVPAHLPGGFSLYGGNRLVGLARSESSHDVALNVATLVMKQLGINGERPPARLSIRAKKAGGQAQAEEEPGAGDMSAFPANAAPSPAPPDLLHIDRTPMGSAGPSPSGLLSGGPMARTGRAAGYGYSNVHAGDGGVPALAAGGGGGGGHAYSRRGGAQSLLLGLDLGEPEASGSMIAGHGHAHVHSTRGALAQVQGVIYGQGPLQGQGQGVAMGMGMGMGMSGPGSGGSKEGASGGRGLHGRAVRARKGGLETGMSSGGSSPDGAIGMPLDTSASSSSAVQGQGMGGGGGGAQGGGGMASLGQGMGISMPAAWHQQSNAHSTGMYAAYGKRSQGGGGGPGMGMGMGMGGMGMMMGIEMDSGTPAILHGVTPSALGVMWGGQAGNGQAGQGGSHLHGGQGGPGVGVVGDLSPHMRSADISPDAAAGLRGRVSSPYYIAHSALGQQLPLSSNAGQAWNTSNNTGGYGGGGRM